MFTLQKQPIDDVMIWQIRGVGERGESIEVWICPEDGMNICKVIKDGHLIVDWDRERWKMGATYGIPILYPTPNRVEGGMFTYQDQLYPMEMHGMVRKAAFEEVACHCHSDVAVVEGRLKFTPGTEHYEQFPFESELSIQIQITLAELTIGYKLYNKDKKPLPYGFALHPFFVKAPGVTIWSDAKKVMGMTEDKLPTGELFEVEGTSFDLSHKPQVESLGLDHVYTELNSGRLCKIHYPSFQMELILRATENFGYLVVFTPQGHPFFCVENQTCATNTHNFYAKGYEKLSGLQLVMPQDVHTGKVSICFHKAYKE